MIFSIPEDERPTFEDFCGEAPELVQAIERALLDIEGGHYDAAALKRSFHTLKGILGIVGLKAPATLAHEAENLFAEGEPGQTEISLLLDCADFFRRQNSLVVEGLAQGSFEILESAELCGRLQRRELKAQDAAETAPDAAQSDSAWVRVGAARLDALLEAVGELAVCQAQVLEGLAGQEEQLGQVSAEARRLGKVSRRLQDVALALRMVPVQPLFSRMQRLCRDLSTKLGKKVRFEATGGDTELDKALVDELSEPLVHLVRNALDHGLEGAPERLALGKAEEGRLSLSASHQGGNFVLRIEDDGRGLDEERIRRKARALGLEEDEDLASLILRPGFSTASALTELSGRGVGLDVVASQVRALKGSLSVESLPLKGCAFICRLPLSVALMDTILFRRGRLNYLLPAHAVSQFVALDDCRVHSSGGARWIETRSLQLPEAPLDGRDPAEEAPERAVAMVVESSPKKVFVVADEVLGRRQVVVKALDAVLARLQGVSGAAVLGDGSVAMVLNLEALSQAARERKAA
jgi:two-component system chemotaxis sensor kinase CheA